MSQIILGIGRDGKNVKADLEILMTGRLLVTANSGAGKTYLLKRMVEQAFGKIQIIVVDPEGEFSPLREKFPFIIVGKGGDVAADVKTAPLLAHRLLETRLSAVCDIYEMRPTDRHAWVAAFCTALVEAPKSFRHPCLVILDEAHMFAPEKGESVALQALADLASRGRKRGLCIVCATQRLALLSKNVTSLLQNRLMGSMFEDVDIKRAGEILGIGPGEAYRDFAYQLRVLEPGNFWALGRAISKEKILFKVGPIETSHGEDANKYATEPPPPPEKVLDLLEKFKDLPKEAEERIKTESQLRQEIRTLHAELRKKSTTPATIDTKQLASAQNVIRYLEQQVADFQGYGTQLRNYAIQKDRAIDEIGRAIEKIGAPINRLVVEGLKMPDPPKPRKESHDQPTVQTNLRTQTPRPAHHVSTPVFAKVETNGDLTGPERKILVALSQLRAIGKDTPSKPMVAGWSGYSPEGGAFGNPIGALRSKGYITYPAPATVQLTAEGLAQVGEQQPPASEQEIQQRILNILTGPERKILAALLNHGKDEISKEDLAAASGYEVEGEAFGNPIGALRTKGFLDYPRPRIVKAADWLFFE